MEIILADHAGFCFGVERAINSAKELAEDKRICTYGPLIHNKNVVKDLEKSDIISINNLEDVNGRSVVLRSHGVPPAVYEYLNDNNIEYFDLTCPYVKKIHRLVEENFIQGNKIIILGDKNHPEVIGINGYSLDSSIIISSLEMLKETDFDPNHKYCLVVQTTFDNNKFNEIIQNIENFNLDIKIFNTICNATIKRQEEVSEISKNVDKMIILGDKSSSNTKKLFEISKNNCINSYLVESIAELELNILGYDDKIGLAAGASTPPCIIKEAVKTMSENNNTDMTFEEMLDQSMVSLHNGQIVKGTILRVSDDGEIYVNLGYKADGIIAREEISDDPDFNVKEAYKQDDEIEVYVYRVNDGEGNVQLSRKKIEAEKNKIALKEAFDNNEIVQGKVTKTVNGGLMAFIRGVQVFVPSSQISNKYVGDLQPFVGADLDFKILEYNPEKNRIVAGRKELVQEVENKRKAEVFDTIEVSQKRTGTVRRLVKFGAFVDLGGIDGLIHISELSWGRVKQVTDVLKEGDVVEVTVIDFDKEKGKISLTLKDVKEDPWYAIEEKFPVGSVVSGKVARMVDFGVFVELEPGIDGLVHISQIAAKHVVKPEDELSVGEIVNVKITEVDRDKKRISLSKKEADAPVVVKEEVEEEVADDTNATTRLVYSSENVEEEVVEETVAEEIAEETTEVLEETKTEE